MVAICDADEKRLNSAGEKRFPKAKRYTDFRKMLEEMGDSIDAVTVSTPDHCHAPFRPYAKGYHPFAWRGWWDFGTGALGDMACHEINMAFMGLDLRNPVSIQAETSGHNKDSFPKWSVVTYQFPANEWRPEVKLDG